MKYANIMRKIVVFIIDLTELILYLREIFHIHDKKERFCSVT